MVTEENFIDFTCPGCQGAVSFPQANAGSVQACPNCSESLIVPDDGSPAGRSVPLPIKTPRLMLRRFAPGDWKDLLEFMSNEELFRHVEGGPSDEDSILRWLEREATVRLTTPGETFFLGIELQDGAKLIGFIGLSFTDPQRLQAAIQVYLNPAFQRQGFALEALVALLDFAFQAIRLHRVTAQCSSQNTPACRLFERLGLRREGEFVKDKLLKGEWVNTVSFAALAEEYRQASPAPP